MAISLAKIPLKMKSIPEVNYCKIFYDAEFGSKEETEILTTRIKSISELKLKNVSDDNKRWAYKCERYRRQLVSDLYPQKAVSLGCPETSNQLFDLLFNFYCTYYSVDDPTHNELALTVDDLTITNICNFFKALHKPCPYCHSQTWMDETYNDDVSIVCGDCQGSVCEFDDVYYH